MCMVYYKGLTGSMTKPSNVTEMLSNGTRWEVYILYEALFYMDPLNDLLSF